MNESHENKPDQENNIPVDREIPSVAAAPKSRTLFIGLLLGLAAMAMIFVVIDGIKKDAPPSLVTPEEITFKSLNSTPAPYIEPAAAQPEPVVIAEAANTIDPYELERERMMQAEALRLAKEQQKRKDERLRSPQLIIDQKSSAKAHTVGTSAGEGNLVAGNSDSNTAFAQQYGSLDVETAQASQIANLSTLIAQGTMISGILETAIQSDLPGMVRAIVSEPVYSHDGSHILIPQGARIIGRYRSGLVRGQSRIFVIWNRILRQDGVSVNIGSMGTDDLGRSGLAGDLDTHFFERFGSSILLSLIDAGLQIGVNSLDNENSATVALESGSDFSKSAEIALDNAIAIPPTINVDQGTKIKVFVAKDLDFSQVAGNLTRR